MLSKFKNSVSRINRRWGYDHRVVVKSRRFFHLFFFCKIIDMSSETDAREWHYCDVLGGAQKGPVPAVVLCRLLEKGVGVSPQTLIWKVGMESWLPMSAVGISC